MVNIAYLQQKTNDDLSKKSYYNLKSTSGDRKLLKELNRIQVKQNNKFIRRQKAYRKKHYEQKETKLESSLVPEEFTFQQFNHSAYMTNWERRNDGSLKKSYVYKKNGKYISWIFDFDGTITGRSMDKAGNITKIFTVEITGQDLDIVLAQNDLHLAKRLIQLGIKPTKNVYFQCAKNGGKEGLIYVKQNNLAEIPESQDIMRYSKLASVYGHEETAQWISTSYPESIVVADFEE